MLLRGGLIHQRSAFLRGVKSMKHLLDRIVDFLPGILIGALIGVSYGGYLSTHMPVFVILTVLVLLAKFA